MRALILNDHEKPPALGSFDDPAATDGADVVTLRSAGLNPFDVVYASGRHPIGRPALPSVVGREGVGTTSRGRRVYFDAAVGPYGSMGERALVEDAHVFDVPEEVGDDVAIALGAAGMSAWIPLVDRAGVTASDRVLVLGATGAVGSVATQLAKLLGARHVVAAGRRPAALQRTLDRGADAIVDLSQPDFADALADAVDGAVDVVIDLLWGAPARAALALCDVNARYVQIGNAAGAEVNMPANPWRTRWVTILGYSGLRAPIERKRAAYAALLGHAVAGEIEVTIEHARFDDAETAWQRLREGPDGKLVVRFDGAS